MEKYRRILLDAMGDLLQRDIVCDYLITSLDNNIILKNVYAIDAYIKALEVSQEFSKDVQCYYYVLEHRAATPVLEVKNGELFLSGVKIDVINT